MTPQLTDAIFSELRNPNWLAAHGWFVAEGRHVTRRLLASRYRAAALLLTPVAHDAIRDAVDALDADRRPEILVRTPAEMDAITGFRLHQGCVAIAERQPLPTWSEMPAEPGLAVCLERIRDPDNVGSIARSAAALGATCMILGPECADPFYRKAIRTSMGALLTFPVFDGAAPWPGVIHSLKAAGYFVIAATPAESAQPLSLVAERLPSSRIVLLVGSEGDGLSAEALGAADVRARIPMAAGTDSMNVAAATAVSIYALAGGSRP